MSFLVRSSSRRWSQNGGLAGVKSFVSARRRGEGPAGSGAASPEDGPTSSGYLLAEVRDARAAVTALDRYLFKVKSFKDASFELVEQAHMAMSRLEQAVAVRAAPELILLACEIKVAARRGAHLLRTYGEYNFFGKMVAWTRRRRVEAKYAAVTERLRGLMPGTSPTPGDATPTSVSGAPSALAPHGGGRGEGGHGLLERAITAASEASGAAPASCGQLLRRGRHERVYCLSFAPQAVAAASGGMCVWWALEAAVEFYSDATGSTTSFGIEGDVFLTHVAIDAAGNTWGGTSRGTLLMRRPRVWDSQAEERLFGSAVRAIAFDAETSTVWAGDEHGCLRAARMRDDGWRIEPLLTALAGCAPRRGLSVGTLLGARNGSRGLRRVISTKQSESAPHALEGPIRCLFVRDDRVWAAGGRSEPWLALFHASTGHQLDIWRCGNHGGCNAMLALTWDTPSSRGTTGSGALSALGPDARGRSCSSGGSGALAGTPPLPVPEDSACGDLRRTWQLLTGHDNGQVLVWNAAADVLQPVCKLGDVGAAVRGMASLDAWGLLATAHANGELALIARPGAAFDWGGGALGAAASHGLSSAGASSVHSSSAGAVPAGTAAIHTTAVGVPCVRPRRLVLRAHRTAIAAAAGCPSGLVTASNQGTLRLWRAPDLAREADRSGLLLGGGALARRPTASAVSASTADSGRLPPFSRQTTASVEAALARPASGSGVAAASAAAPAAATATAPAPGPPAGPAAAVASPRIAASLASALPGDRTASGPLPQGAFGGAAAAASTGLRSAVGHSEPLPRFGADNGGADAYHAAAAAAAGMILQPVEALPDEGDDGEGAAWRLSGLGQLRVSAPSPALSGQLGAQSSPFAGGAAAPFRPALPSASPAGSPTVGAGGAGAVTRYGSGPALAPRKPRAQRQVDALQQAESRERRKSERRLSKGAQIAWSACQIIESRELKLQSSIGSGAYGRVWLAEWMGTQVAAKELLCLTDRAKDDVSRKRRERRADADGAGDAASDSGSDSSEDSVEAEVAAELKELMNEVYMLGSLSHPNIMRFCAVCLDPPMIVTQYYQHGSLFQLLKKARRGDKRAQAELSWSKRLDMLRDVASGMVFLHSRRPPVVHGDLRSPNLLLDMAFDRDKPRLHVKIADFGLACMMGPAKTLAVSKVSNPRWSAPEVIRDSSVSTSADVFSYGVVMWELLTWQQPYEDMMSVQVLFSVMQNLRPDVPEDAELPGRPGPSLQGYKALMEACWHEDAEQRPSFEAIVVALDDMRAADRAARGDAGATSRRTSYSGESALSSPHASAANSASAFASGRSYAAEDSAWGGAGVRAVAADLPTYLEDDGPGAAAQAAAAAPEQRSSAGAGGSAGPGPAGGGSGNGGAGSARASQAFISPFSEHSAELPSASSGQGSPGPFGASEPSFAFFAGGAGGGAGSAHPGVGGGSPFGFAAAQAAPEGGSSPSQQQQQHYATAEALRAPSRTPSRLGRGSTSASGTAGLPGAVTTGGLTSMHSPRAARPSSPFAAVQEAPAAEAQQPDVPTQLPGTQHWSPFAAAAAVAGAGDAGPASGAEQQVSAQAVAAQPWSPFAAVAAQPEAGGGDSPVSDRQQQQQQGQQGQQEQQQGQASSPPTPSSPFAAASAQTGWPSGSAAPEKRMSPFAAVDLGPTAASRLPRGGGEGAAVRDAQPPAAASDAIADEQGLAVPDAPAEASFLFGIAPPPGLEHLRQEQAQQQARGGPAASNNSLTFPSPRRRR